MNGFKGLHFNGEVVLWAVRWYCRYGISYRDLETIMAERGVHGRSLDHLPLGAEIRTGNGKTDALAMETSDVG